MGAGVLEGIRIVECTFGIAGPVATHLLAEVGADVVKVEPPRGDVTRGTATARSVGMKPCVSERAVNSAAASSWVSPAASRACRSLVGSQPGCTVSDMASLLHLASTSRASPASDLHLPVDG
ncbi:CoA transferase [Frankia sp. Cas4]|uniref:CoA transferase n=1 Tax=Frankia sp. Cas4 TaxID=3073927 RepID=UPI003A0FEA35